MGRAGVRLGLGHVERRRDGLRRPAAGPGVREPRDARRRLADAPAAADRAGPRAGGLPARATGSTTCIFPPPPNTTADRASDLLAATSALAYLRATRAASAAPEAARLTDADPGAGRRADRRAERGRRLALGRTRRAGHAPQTQRPDDLGARRPGRSPSAEPLGLLTDPKALDKAGDLPGRRSSPRSAAATTRPAPCSCTP